MSPAAPRVPLGSARAIALCAFDVAIAIDLERIPAMLQPGRARIVGRKPAPPYLRYAVAPVEIALGERRLAVGAEGATARVTARVFDFGALSIALEIDLPPDLAAFPAAAAALSRLDVARDAAMVRDELLADIRPALEAAITSEVVEDYVVFVADPGRPDEPVERFVVEHAALLAGALSMDDGPLSLQQIADAVREPISYTPHDLVIAGWSAALVLDADPDDTVLVLDFLNVQLVELRVLDAQLDAALARHSAAIYREPGLWSAIRGPHRLAIRELSDRMIEGQQLRGRVENALELVPDVYLARVHRRTATRLGLATRQSLVDGKLEAMRHLTSVLVERAAAWRAEALEITIIALIALEIGLALAGR